MEFKYLKRYIFTKLIFPRVFILDRPGIIISKTSSLYSHKGSRKRIIWYFEDSLADLQRETIARIGKKQADDIYYKIGKELGINFMGSITIKKIPGWLSEELINYIFLNFGSHGATVARKISYEKEILKLEGQDNIVCRKTFSPSLSAGIIAGIMTALTGKNFDSEYLCKNCPSNCKIITKPSKNPVFQTMLPNINVSEDYKNMNFQLMDTSRQYKENSFTDLIKFKKICIRKNNKFQFYNRTITLAPISFFKIMINNYESINLLNLFKKSIVKSSRNLAKEFFMNIANDKNKIKFLLSVLSSFGWGIPIIKRQDRKIIVTYLYPPFSECESSKEEYLYLALIIEGFLDAALNKKCKINKIEKMLKPAAVSIEYTLLG